MALTLGKGCQGIGTRLARRLFRDWREVCRRTQGPEAGRPDQRSAPPDGRLRGIPVAPDPLGLKSFRRGRIASSRAVEGGISISVYDGNARLYSHTLGNIAPIDESEYIAGAHRPCTALNGT